MRRQIYLDNVYYTGEANDFPDILELRLRNYLEVTLSLPPAGCGVLPLFVHIGPRMFLNVGPVDGDAEVRVFNRELEELRTMPYTLGNLKTCEKNGIKGLLLDLYRDLKIFERWDGKIHCDKHRFPELVFFYDVVANPETRVSTGFCSGSFRFASEDAYIEETELLGSMDLSFLRQGLTVGKSPISRLACEFHLKESVPPGSAHALPDAEDLSEALEEALGKPQTPDAVSLKQMYDYYLKAGPALPGRGFGADPRCRFLDCALRLETGPVIYELNVSGPDGVTLRVRCIDGFTLKKGEKPSPSVYRSPNGDVTEILDLLLRLLHRDPDKIAAFCLKLKVLGYSETKLPPLKFELPALTGTSSTAQQSSS